MANYYDEEILGARQQAETARKLREMALQENPQGQMISGHYVAPSWTQGLATGLRALAAAQKENAAEGKIKDIQNERAQAIIGALNQAGISAPSYLLKQAGTPEQQPAFTDRALAFLRGQDQPQATPAVPYQQNVAQNVTPEQRDAAMMNLYGIDSSLATPMIAHEQFKLQQQQAADLKREALQARQEEALANRQSREEMARIANQNRLDLAALNTSNRQPQSEFELRDIGGSPVLFNRFTGKIQESNAPISQKPLTESQSNAKLFGKRMDESNQILNQIGTQYSPLAVSSGFATENVPLIGSGVNAALGENEQKIMQAQRDFLNAALRKESGASISSGELANGRKQYFPQPGDSVEVISQKAKNRDTAIQGILEAVPEKQRNVHTSRANQPSDIPFSQEAIQAEIARRKGGQ